MATEDDPQIDLDPNAETEASDTQVDDQRERFRVYIGLGCEADDNVPSHISVPLPLAVGELITNTRRRLRFLAIAAAIGLGAVVAGSCASGYILSEATHDDNPTLKGSNNYIPPDYYKLAAVDPAPSLEKHEDVVMLINECVSMSVDEKERWIKNLPTMSERHIAELKQALIEEKEKLAEAEAAEEAEKFE